MKTCNDCQKEKLASEFYTNSGRLMNPCKDCRREQKRRGLVGLKRIGI